METIREGFLRKNIGLGKDVAVKKWVEENINAKKHINVDVLDDSTLRITLNDGGYFYDFCKSNSGMLDVPEYITISEIVYNANETLVFRNLNVKDWTKFLPKTINIVTNGKLIGLSFMNCNITPKDIKNIHIDVAIANLIIRQCKSFSGNLDLDLSHLTIPYLISVDNDVDTINIRLNSHGGFPGLSLTDNENLTEITGDIHKISQLYLTNTKMGDALYYEILDNASKNENLKNVRNLLLKNQASKNRVINKCESIKDLFNNFTRLTSILIKSPQFDNIEFVVRDKNYRTRSLKCEIELNIKKS